MKINLKTPIKNYSGETYKTRDTEEGPDRDLNINDLIILALNNTVEGEVLTAEQKAKSYNISSRVYGKKELDLSIEEIHFVIERAEKVFINVAFLGQLKEILDPPAKDNDGSPEKN